MHNFIWISSTMPKFRKKTNDIIPRKHPDRWKEGRKDGQTLFYRTLPASARDLIKNYLSFTLKQLTSYSSK